MELKRPDTPMKPASDLKRISFWYLGGIFKINWPLSLMKMALKNIIEIDFQKTTSKGVIVVLCLYSILRNG